VAKRSQYTSDVRLTDPRSLLDALAMRNLCLIWTSLLCGFNISIIKILSSLNTAIYCDVIKKEKQLQSVGGFFGRVLGAVKRDLVRPPSNHCKLTGRCRKHFFSQNQRIQPDDGHVPKHVVVFRF
jgi:hypothetical protein